MVIGTGPTWMGNGTLSGSLSFSTIESRGSLTWVAAHVISSLALHPGDFGLDERCLAGFVLEPRNLVEGRDEALGGDRHVAARDLELGWTNVRAAQRGKVTLRMARNVASTPSRPRAR